MRHALALVAVATLALVGCSEDAADPDIVARAGSYRLTVDDVVQLLQDEESLPTQAGVVESLAELWIDYTLLAEAVAEDTTFSDLDFGALVRQQLERDMIFQLRDSVIQVDTFLTPEELRDLYASRAPDVELRARHIMLTLPFEPTAAQRDSVRQLLQELRNRIQGGARFEELARQYSQDPGSAQAGGDIGFFSRGDLVQPFEDAVLALEPGELSPVVETPMGYHLIRLEERRVADFEEIAPSFRARVQAERTAAAESTFVAALEGGAPPRITEEALAVTRQLARDPGLRLTSRAAGRPLVEWSDGAYRVRELQQLFQFEQPAMRDQVIASTDEDLTGFLRNLARRKMLVEEARVSGLEPDRARVDSLSNVVRGQLLAAARQLGLTRLEQAPGESRQVAIQRAVRQAIRDNLAGATRIVPLGLLGFQLRQGVSITLSDAGIGSALLRIAEVRASRRQSPVEEALDSAALSDQGAQPPDSAGR